MALAVLKYQNNVASFCQIALGHQGIITPQSVLFSLEADASIHPMNE